MSKSKKDRNSYEDKKPYAKRKSGVNPIKRAKEELWSIENMDYEEEDLQDHEDPTD